MRRMLVFGHGYSAGWLTPLLIADGWQVAGTTRGDGARIEALGARALAWPGDGDALRSEIARADAILISAGPDRGGDPVLRDFAGDIARSTAGWIGYLSTTGVYGDRHGGWVDETTPPEPSTQRGQARLLAERDWQDLAARHGLPLHVFRLAGIYGPGRGPFEKLRQGSARRIVKPGQVFSRIHVADIARVLMASIAQPEPGTVYNVCDDDAAPPEDVIAHAAGLLGVPVPPAEDYATAAMTPMARSFYAESKRVANDRIKDRLKVRLAYPDYRAGLAALLRDGP